MSTQSSIKIPLLLGLLALILTPGEAAATIHHRHHKPHHSPAYVDHSAGYADIVMDAETGRILHATNQDSLRHPASLTKMMTLYLTFQALESGRLNLNQSLAISTNAAEQSPSKLGLRPGQRIRTEDAILGLVTESANDAAVVLGESLGGSEEGFGQLMTKEAHALGMSHTQFDNPSGLPDPDQVTTARDMAVLGHALIYHYPQFYPYFSHDSFTYAGIYHHNHNHLMDRYDGMDGIKTGYIRASGFNLVASAKRGSTRLIGVVFGGRSATARDNHMAQLLDQAFVDAQKEKNSVHIASGSAPLAQGDGSEDDADESPSYVTLPAKVAAIFPTKEAALPTPPPRPIQTLAPPAAVSVPTQASVIVPQPPATSWGIQIGAYGDPEIGRAALTNLSEGLPQLLGTANPVVQKITSGSVTMYRARLMGLDQRQAQAACTYLIQHAQSCLTVGP